MSEVHKPVIHKSHMADLGRTAFVLAFLSFWLMFFSFIPAPTEARGIANYLPLHTLLETVAIVFASLIFAVSWHSFSDRISGNVVFIGCAFLGVALLDFSHLLSFAGMPDFVTPSDPEKAIDFWLAARMLAVLSLLWFVSTPWRHFESRGTTYLLLAAVVVFTAIIYWLVLFHPNLIPRTFVQGSGLTPSKLYAEYTIISIALIAILILLRRMRESQAFNASAMLGALGMMVLGELCFTLYDEVSDVFNLLGHIYKVVSYLFIYHAIFVTTIKAPYLQLSESQRKLKDTLDALPDLLFELDIEGRIIDHHAPRTEHPFAPMGAFTGKSIETFLPYGGAAIIRESLHEANDIGSSAGKRFSLSSPSGIKWFELSVTRKTMEAGGAPHFILLSRDITDRVTTKSSLVESNNLLQSVINTAPIRIFWKDRQSRYMGCNLAFAKDAGVRNPEELIGKDDHELSWKAQADVYQADDRLVIETGVPKLGYDEPQVTPDGRTIWLRTSKVPLRNAEQEIIGMLGFYEDVTSRRESDEKLRMLSLAVAQSSNNIIITDHNGKIEYVNAAFTKTTGYSASDVVGKNPRMLKSGKTPAAIYQEMWARLSRGEGWQGELVNRRKNGQEYVEFTRITPILQGDGTITHYMGVKDDITEKKRDEERINFLANFDSLTGLPNRTRLEEYLTYALTLAKRNDGNLALMFIDLDHFKDINDTLGHSVGDDLLVQLATKLRLLLREEDTIARFGGDEFVVMLPGTDSVGAAQVAQKIIDALAQPFQVGHLILNTSASIGIALYPNDGMDLGALFKNADAAMYRAKQEGRSAYRFFTAEMEARSSRNLKLTNELRLAIERDQLSLQFQPQLSLQNGTIIGAEALLRWNHPELGHVSPAEFIPVAENSGLIIPIGEWVLRRAIQQTKQWMDAGLPPLIIAVNLSAIQFRQPQFPELVTRILDEVGLPPEYLELELTEGVAMSDPQGAIAIMNKLHDRGVRMSIDDFGTGYSSLNYLKKFKVYKLKIDQSFVRDISTDSEDKAIVGTIINMAKNLGLSTIAEGVETPGQLAFLREQGCDDIQGYYFSKPLLAEQFLAFAHTIQR